MDFRYYALLGIVAIFLFGAAAGCGTAAKKAASKKSVNVERTQMMGGGCPMCGGPMGGRGSSVNVPDKLPTPKSKEWISRLKDIYSLEKLSLAQYSADEDKYRINMPYRMILPQEENHISLISQMFAAYGIKADIKTPAIKRSNSVTQALETGKNIESTSIPKYTWLITNAEDNTTRQILSSILLQTRMHYVMFTHAIDMQNMGM